MGNEDVQSIRRLLRQAFAEMLTLGDRVVALEDARRDDDVAPKRRMDFRGDVDLNAGVTGVVAISESHLCIHTWPEHGYAAVDIFTCGGSPRLALAELQRSLDVENMEIRELDRGLVGQSPSRPARPARDRRGW